MQIKRRDFILAATTAVVVGCKTNPKILSPLSESKSAIKRVDTSSGLPPHHTSSIHKTVGGQKIISRSQWTAKGQKLNQINRMNGVSKITIHHTGGPYPFYGKSYSDSKIFLEKVRHFHADTRKWADIGYHFGIDRAGRVWECRPIQYQGAHVKNNNSHNIGVMLMGNFDKQKPANSQLRSLQALVKEMGRTYKIPVSSIHTHGEINPTACPGKHLQAFVNRSRRNGAFAI